MVVSKNYEAKIGVLDRLVRELLGVSIFEFIESRRWKESTKLCIDVIKNTLTDEEMAYINAKLGSLHQQMDVRTPVDYARDIVLGWVAEDAVFTVLSEFTRCELTGADRDREFLGSVTSYPDMAVQVSEGMCVPVEIVLDYTGYCLANNRLELRLEKYRKLVEMGGFILGLDLKNWLFFLAPVETGATEISQYKQYGGKAVASIELKTLFYDIGDMRSVFRYIFSK